MLVQVDKKARGRRTRRGVTLVEMLVTVAVLVIMMTILVQIFQSATGALSSAQSLQQIDDQLRRLDGRIRSDLEGVTARFTPPLDPALNLGYFEYGENEFADNQGEDCDDYIRFTAKAPEGRPFTGRFWPNYWYNSVTGQLFQYSNNASGNNAANFPITITSDFAEIIYFLRNGNLYRRVFLVAPDMQSAIVPTVNNTGYYQNSAGGVNSFTFQPTILGQQVSWLGVNDLSARPSATGPNANSTPTLLAQAQATIVLNTLGDLTNRENRAFYPRFASDFYNVDPSGTMGQYIPDGLADDINQDNIPDLYPSLYYHNSTTGIFSPSNLAGQLIFPPTSNSNTTGLAQLASNPGISFLSFPYVFPGAYSKAQQVAHDQYGWIHAPSPQAIDPQNNQYQYDTQTSNYLQYLNHNPLSAGVGDNLPAPNNATLYQTWWGFPTWRETLSPSWNDPTVQVNVGPFAVSKASPQNPVGLNYASLNVTGGQLTNFSGDGNLLPPMIAPTSFTGDFSVIRQTQQLFSDGAGQASAFWGGASVAQAGLWAVTWEDDLIMTNVRSFDVKAYDNALANYGDLGWADDLRLYQPYQTMTGAVNFTLPPAIASTSSTIAWPPINPSVVPYTPVFATLQTMAHEGRMPPLQADNRLDYQNPNPNYISYTTGNFTPQYAAYPLYSSNVGDDNNGIVRLRRVWDTWSTEYSRAPANGVANASGGFPVGPPFSPPVYPSYPPPYPAPLRGIQIQIRVNDPSSQRVKQLTIRQDFTDKL